MDDRVASSIPQHVDAGRGEKRLCQVLETLLPIPALAIAAFFSTLVSSVSAGKTFTVGWNWVPSLDVRLSFHVDGLSLLFVLLISGIGTLIFVYAPGYLGAHPDRGRLYAWLLLFMGAMLGLILANNIITLFMFWELTSITSYMLIGFKHESEKARDAALQALLVTGLGGLALLAGLLLMGEAGGSYELTTLLNQSDALKEHPLLVPMVMLILLGAFTKSAQFPFHFWLPSAMEAPTPVSAYLHSATMVKAGIYLVARLTPAFGGMAVWNYSIVAIGALTALTGAVLAIQQTDLKRILAFSTVSALGTLMLLLGIGTPLAIQAAIVFLLCHSLYKGALFLVAGSVDHCVGTRDVRKLSGLARVMPVLASAAVLAGLSMAGLPPAGGFLAKELVYESALDLSRWSLPIVAAVLAVNVTFVVVAGLVSLRPFFGQKPSTAESTHHVGWRLAFPPLLLGFIGLAIGLLPALFSTHFVGPAVMSINGDIKQAPLKLWHGFNLPLVLSVLTLVAGTAVYAAWSRIQKRGLQLLWLAAYGPSAGYELALRALKFAAAWQTRVLQNGRLRVYLLVVLIAFAALVGFELLDHIEIPSGDEWLDVQLYELFIPAIILCAIVMAVRSSSRLAAVCALGVIGYAVAMLFVMFGAPDLAMTQLAIETLTVILFVFVIYRLPRFNTISRRAARLRDACVAIVAGGVMTAVVLAATFAHAPSRVSQYFVDNSSTAAKGKNMVNVILVDFRGLDTLGEITVLAVAAIGIFVLMRLRLSPPRAAGGPSGGDDDKNAGDTSASDKLSDSPKITVSSPSSASDAETVANRS